MKQTLLLCLVISIFQLSCSQYKKGYEIDVNVSNLNANKVFLYTMKRTPLQGLYWPNIDSASVVNGIAKLKRDTVLDEPSWSSGIYYIDTISGKRRDFVIKDKFKDKGTYGNFILENTHISIMGDAKAPVGLEIDGSPESDMNMRYGLIVPNISAVNKRIDEARKKYDHKLLSEAQDAKNHIVKSFKKRLNILTEQNSSSWMILMNVYQNATLFSPKELIEITRKFDIQLLATPKGKALTNFTKQSKSLVVGADFPQFNYIDDLGKKWSLNDVKGRKGTLIIFWASWCGPCRREIPELKKIFQSYQAKGINLVSISTDHDIAAWRLAMKQEAMPWLNLSNLPGDNKLINSAYNLQAIPAIYLLDSGNKIVMPNENQISIIMENLEKVLRKG